MKYPILFILIAYLVSFHGSPLVNAEEKSQSSPQRPGIWFEWHDQSNKDRPWEVWNQARSWYKPPAEREILSAYYGSKNREFEILEYKRIEPLTVSELDEKYKLGSIFRIKARAGFRKMMLSDGWKEVLGNPCDD